MVTLVSSLVHSFSQTEPRVPRWSEMLLTVKPLPQPSADKKINYPSFDTIDTLTVSSHIEQI